jgi:hypothetical protein
MKRIASLSLLLSGLSILFWGCSDFLGKKTDLDFIEIPQYQRNSEAYIPILPAWSGFVNPTDVLAGYDDLVYVVDSGTSEIQAFDVAGRLLHRMRLPGVKAVAQTRMLEILAIGQVTLPIGPVDAIFRIDPKLGSSYRISEEKITDTIVHPLYFKTALATNDIQVKLNDIAVRFDNSFYVTRSGPTNNPNQFGGPDNSILLFDNAGKFVGPLNVNTIEGSIRNFFATPFGITTFVRPPTPPSIVVPQSNDFFTSVVDPTVLIKVQNITSVLGEDGVIYSANTQFIAGDTSRADGFLTTPNKFKRPVGITTYNDRQDFIIVSDTETDSVYVFGRNGLEGIPPLPSSNSTKHINVSFGGVGQGPKNFIDPTAVAIVGRLLYVCDKGNKRIMRYQLSRDLN